MNVRRGPVLPAYATQVVEGPAGHGSSPMPAPAAPSAPASSREVVRTTFEAVTKVDSVGQTHGSWAGCDVFVALPPPTISGPRGTLSVFVWANASGGRYLAASGRLVVGTRTAALFSDPQRLGLWVASARGLADSWEVTAAWQQAAAAPLLPGAVSFTMCASNEPAPVPEDLGAVPMAGAIGGGGTGAGSLTGIVAALQQPAGAGVSFTPDLLELLNVQAINGAAAARFVHVHDTVDGLTAIAGIAPVLALPMGAAIGAGISERIRYRARGKLSIVASSSLATTTQVADCILSATVR